MVWFGDEAMSDDRQQLIGKTVDLGGVVVAMALLGLLSKPAAPNAKRRRFAAVCQESGAEESDTDPAPVPARIRSSGQYHSTRTSQGIAAAQVRSAAAATRVRVEDSARIARITFSDFSRGKSSASSSSVRPGRLRLIFDAMVCFCFEFHCQFCSNHKSSVFHHRSSFIYLSSYNVSENLYFSCGDNNPSLAEMYHVANIHVYMNI